ncbi:GNAT family N-acetyltransferase [Brevibacterium sp. UCMA 11752]|uniref:GNAT family N-acetyltransferase n=1 Tax=Brevibacterium sp. UCMA 11752 TaxID=2745946 RepID=UPI002E2290D5
MSISLSRLDPNGVDRSGLIDFFTSNDFPFHVRPERWTAAGVEERIESGAFRSDDYDTFWLQHEQLGSLGIVRLEDLTDDTPMFDLRLATELRGQGLGTECLRAITDHVLMTMDVDRFEGNTRDDNIAMRSTFIRAGWSKEAHYRRAWPVAGRTPRDSVAYAILREEWKSGAGINVHWHDLPMFTPQLEDGVEYASNSVPGATELIELYRSVGWSTYTQNPVSLHKSVLSSAHVVSARRDGELIGLARVISDFGSVMYLQDVLVHPVHQRRGIGRQLVTRALTP